jgi:hypothetical protein
MNDEFSKIHQFLLNLVNLFELCGMTAAVPTSQIKALWLGKISASQSKSFILWCRDVNRHPACIFLNCQPWGNNIHNDATLPFREIDLWILVQSWQHLSKLLNYHGNWQDHVTEVWQDRGTIRTSSRWNLTMFMARLWKIMARSILTDDYNNKIHVRQDIERPCIAKL